ncbi:MAG TPA: hypothetical protein VI935_04890 [Thermodesulfobacteriota bacterium]|nr:hypothetical protein [Thermodesulfobacteriota bacterium]
MANLFWKTKAGTKSLLETPFKTEEEFESTVFNTSELLEEIFLLRRQIRGGSKTGIPDIVGIDGDGNICIIEMKNKPVDASIIPQVLEYALWAETNPDSIKSLWLESENKPDDIPINWEDFDVRILIIAPYIHRSTLEFVQKINYLVDLIEIKKWAEENSQILMVNKLEEEKSRTKPVRGLQKYDEAFYKSKYNKTSVGQFFKYVKEVEKTIKKKGWSLDTKYNKNYCAFKAGFFNAFRISWMGAKSFASTFRIPEKETKKIKIPITKYDPERHRAYYYIEPDITKVNDFIPLFEYCYKQIAGDSGKRSRLAN